MEATVCCVSGTHMLGLQVGISIGYELLYFTLLFGKRYIFKPDFFLQNNSDFELCASTCYVAFSFPFGTDWFLNVSWCIHSKNILAIVTALKCARIINSKHRVYSLLTHQLIAIPAFYCTSDRNIFKIQNILQL